MGEHLITKGTMPVVREVCEPKSSLGNILEGVFTVNSLYMYRQLRIK